MESGRVWNTADDPHFAGACGRLNEGHQAEVLRLALDDLRTWATSGIAPAASPRIEVIPDSTTVVRDAHGNALGGIRTLFGRTTAFDPEVLSSLYTDHDDYVSKVRSEANAAGAAEVP